MGSQVMGADTEISMKKTIGITHQKSMKYSLDQHDASQGRKDIKTTNFEMDRHTIDVKHDHKKTAKMVGKKCKNENVILVATYLY
jgi:hypothetical protein